MSKHVEEGVGLASPTNGLTLGYMPGTGQSYPFDKVYQHVRNIKEAKNIVGIDALLVWGGTDIHPSYYNQKPHWSNQQRTNIMPIQRDVDEWRAMKWARAHGVPIIGVCRGAQMACAFSGGRLIQDVNNHDSGHHEMVCEDGVVRTTNSLHHQMMYPFEVEHRLIAWAQHRSDSYVDGNGFVDMDKHNYKEPEIVYFPETKALAIQGHPEWMPESGEFVKYCLELVRQEFFNEVEA